MYKGFDDNIFEERVKTCEDVMYKVLDKDDRDFQGLYKVARTYYIDSRGMGLVLKQSVEPGDIFLIDVFIQDDNTLIKACCDVISCDQHGQGEYHVRLDFIIIKEVYKIYWEELLSRRSNALAI